MNVFTIENIKSFFIYIWADFEQLGLENIRPIWQPWGLACLTVFGTMASCFTMMSEHTEQGAGVMLEPVRDRRQNIYKMLCVSNTTPQWIRILSGTNSLITSSFYHVIRLLSFLWHSFQLSLTRPLWSFQYRGETGKKVKIERHQAKDRGRLVV